MSKSSKAVKIFHAWREFKCPERRRGRRGGRPACPDRAVMNAIWYVLDVPMESHSSHLVWRLGQVHARTLATAWSVREDDGTTCQALRKRRKVKWKWQSLDSKSCPAPLGGEATGCNPTDRAKQGSKLHLEFVCQAFYAVVVERQHFHKLPQVSANRRETEPNFISECAGKESRKLASLRSLRLCPYPLQYGGFWIAKTKRVADQIIPARNTAKKLRSVSQPQLFSLIKFGF